MYIYISGENKTSASYWLQEKVAPFGRGIHNCVPQCIKRSFSHKFASFPSQDI